MSYLFREYHKKPAPHVVVPWNRLLSSVFPIWRTFMTFSLSSGAFANGGSIPKAQVQDGDNKSPPLRWQGAPQGTKSLVLVVEDHDAPVGTVTHWVVYDIPPDSNGLLEGLDANQVPQGRNDMGHAGYDGPKPPKGHGPHRYHFRLAALDTASLALPDNPDRTRSKRPPAAMCWPRRS
jgi:Raf kinase inhibitor-like YbhB/YbcL family protein